MTQTIVNLGTGGAVLNGRNGSTTGADSNDALFLDWTGENYVYLPGVNGNWMTTPHDAAFEIVDDLDIIAHIRPTIGSNSTITRSGVSASTTTFNFQLLTAGQLNLQTGTGVAESVSSSEVIPTASGEPVWVRVTRNKTAAQIIFYTGTDGINWTQLGSTGTYSGNSALTSGEITLRIGATTATNSPLTGDIYQLIIKDGIGGTKVLDVDTSVLTTGAATSFTALTGQTVTINRSTSGRKSVAVVSPCWLFGTDDYMEVADNALLDFDVSEPFTALAVVRQWNDGVHQAIIHKANGSTGFPGWRLYLDSGTRYRTYFRDDDGVVEATQITRVAPVSKVYVVSTRNDPAADVVWLDNQDGSNFTNAEFTGTTFANSVPLRIGSNSTAVNLTADMELLAVAVFRRLLTTSELAAITSYYESRWS